MNLCHREVLRKQRAGLKKNLRMYFKNLLNSRSYLSGKTVSDIYLQKSLKDLDLKPRYYCPILKTKANGELIFEHVTEYNSRWLPKTKKGWEKEPHEYDALDPVEIWQEDAWTFVRRMVGDYLGQKLFYEFLTITWILDWS